MDFTLYDQLQNPVLVVDKDLKIVYFNFICGSYFKMPPRKLKQIQKLDELIRCEGHVLDELAQESITQDTSKFTEEIVAQIGESSQQAALILKFIPLEEGLAAVHVMDFSIERQLHEKYKKQITELKETHEQIVRSDKLTALGEMIAGISHEIATPLTIVSDRLSKMEAALSANDLNESSAILPELQNEFGRITQIISGMQSYARNQEEELQISDLADCAAESVQFIRDLGILGDIQLEANFTPGHLAMANPLKLQQVFINLIKNSVDALKNADINSKKIQISIDESEMEQMHFIRVVDNGVGIPAEAKDKIFEMFYTSKELGEGTGLGLNISQKIIEGHNGSICLVDTEQGCEFLIQLPIVEVGSFTHTNRYLRGESEIEDEKVLVVGDDIELMNEIYKHLKEKNKVCVFSTKVERLEELADFFAVDWALKLKQCDLSFLDAPVLDYVGKDRASILQELGKSF